MTDYAIPIQVNGYSCSNCTEVADAKKNIDPQHPQDGPFGVNAVQDPSSPSFSNKAVQFGGALSGLNDSGRATSGSPTPPRRLDITA